LARKLTSGVMVALIAILSFFGTGGQAFAASSVGGPSLSKWVYGETDELLHQAPVMFGMPEIEIWKAIDQGIEEGLSNPNLDVYHIFQRVSVYGLSSELTGAYDAHDFVTVEKIHNAKPVRFQGSLYFENPSGSTVPYSSLRIYNKTATALGPAGIDWDKYTYPRGLGMPSLTKNGKFVVTVIDKITSPYDPNKPPSYALPGYNQPTQPSTPPGGGNGVDPDFPVQPTPPDNNWDLIGWIKYIVDWLVYLVKCFVYFLKSFGTAVSDVVTGSASLISALKDFFAFLPNQITTVVGMGIVAMIIVGVVKR